MKIPKENHETFKNKVYIFGMRHTDKTVYRLDAHMS